MDLDEHILPFPSVLYSLFLESRILYLLAPTFLRAYSFAPLLLCSISPAFFTLFFFSLLNPYFPITLCTTYSLALFTVIIYETLGKFEQLYMTTTWLPRNYLRDELAEETSCKYADWRQMCTWVLLGCNLEMYRILREQMWSFLANFYFCVDWSIFLLLGMRLYLHLKTACLAMRCKFYLGS